MKAFAGRIGNRARKEVSTSGVPATRTERVSSERFIFVDFLRGIAALLVAFFHVQIHVVWRYPDYPIAKDSFTYHFVFGDFGLGTYGVAVFFMISGFLIPSTLRGPNAGLKPFVIARFFRLYPTYWLSLLGAVLPGALSGALFPPIRILANATMLQGYMSQADIIGVYWTLQIELTFYALCAGLFHSKWLDRSEALVTFLLAASLACAALRFELNRKLPVAMFLALSLMFLSDIVRRARVETRLKRHLPAYLALTCAVIVPTCWLAYGPSWRMCALSYLAAIATFLLAYRFSSVFAWSRATRAVSGWLGEISYTVYLFHALMAPPVWSFLVNRGVAKETSVALSLAVTALFSTITYRLFERHFIDLGRKLAWRTPQAASVGAISRAD